MFEEHKLIHRYYWPLDRMAHRGEGVNLFDYSKTLTHLPFRMRPSSQRQRYILNNIQIFRLRSLFIRSSGLQHVRGAHQSRQGVMQWDQPGGIKDLLQLPFVGFSEPNIIRLRGAVPSEKRKKGEFFPSSVPPTLIFGTPCFLKYFVGKNRKLLGWF